MRKETIGPCVLWRRDCVKAMKSFEPCSVDAVVTDPPYGLEFMGKEWDRLGATIETASEATDKSHPFRDGSRRVRYGTNTRTMQKWHHAWASAALRVLKPGGYMLAFGGTRTYHRLACAVEDAGFEIRDCLMWVYGSGFPKGKGCLKPAYEPILLCRKPGAKVRELGIDACRINPGELVPGGGNGKANHGGRFAGGAENCGARPLVEAHTAGRWPANVVHDGSDEVMEAFAAFGESKSTSRRPIPRKPHERWREMEGREDRPKNPGVLHGFSDTGTAARFFYTAKASRRERGKSNSHPTVKPLTLMEWLVKLACPEDGTVFDPFMGSGTTGVACIQTDRKFVGVEKNDNYFDTACRRIEREAAKPRMFKLSEIARKPKTAAETSGFFATEEIQRKKRDA